MIYTVRQGDYLAKICKDHGLGNCDAIWNLPQNASLRSSRKDPNVLFPGDKVVLPDVASKQIDLTTGTKHRFKLLAKPLRLRIRLRGFAAEPLVGMACRFDVDGTERPEQTDGDGFFERVIPATVQQARISFDDPTAPFHARLPLNVKVGQLDPVEERSGQAARLNNLGYDAGPLDPSPSVQDAANTGAGSTRTAASDDSSADVRTEDDPEFDGIVEDIDAPPPADADESSGDTASPVDLIALQFRSAVEEFQCDNQLTVDGKCGPNTQAKLKAVHGS